MRFTLLLVILSVFVSVNSTAETDRFQDIKKSLETVLPDLEVTRIEESKIPGLYAVMIGAEIFYVSTDARYLLRGDLFDLRGKTNLTEQQRTVARAMILEEIPESDYIEYSPASPQHTVYVFTDVTCPYCQKLQDDVAEINKRGISLRFLAFPRHGTGTPGFNNMVSVWCAGDRNKALTEAMAGKTIPASTCSNPVEQQFMLGQALGVRGTPAIYTEDGRLFPGYMPPDELLRVVNNR